MDDMERKNTKDKMIVKIGGSMGFKIKGNPYENIEATSFLTIEKEVPSDMSNKELQDFFNRIDKLLAEEAANKIKIAKETYTKKVLNLKNAI